MNVPFFKAADRVPQSPNARYVRTWPLVPHSAGNRRIRRIIASKFRKV